MAGFAELVEMLAACGMQIGEVTEDRNYDSYCVHADVGWDGYHEAELEVSGCAKGKVMLDLTATWWSRSADQE